MEQFDFKKFHRQQKIQEIKYEAKKKVQNAINWTMANKEFVLMAAPVVIGGVKLLSKSNTARVERITKETMEYDPRTGHYWKIKRRMNTKEALEFDRRYRNGESKGDILASMRLLK